MFRQRIHRALGFQQRSKFRLNNQERPLMAGIRVPAGWPEDTESQPLIGALQTALRVQLAASRSLLHRPGPRPALTTLRDSLPTSPSPLLTHSGACRPQLLLARTVSASPAATCTHSQGRRHGYELSETGDGQKLAQPLWLQKLFLILATQDYSTLLFGGIPKIEGGRSTWKPWGG